MNGYALFGRCHLNASAVIKNLDGPVYRILVLRRESALKEMAVKPLTQFPVHLEQEALEEKYHRFTGVRTVTVRKSTLGLGIMIIEGKHTDLGRGVFISDIQSGSPAEQSGLAVGDMILCVNQTDLICSDYDTAASLLKNAEGLLSIVVAKPSKSCLKPSLSHGPDSSHNRLSSSSNTRSLNITINNNNNKEQIAVPPNQSPSCSQNCWQKSESSCSVCLSPPFSALNAPSAGTMQTPKNCMLSFMLSRSTKRGSREFLTVGESIASLAVASWQKEGSGAARR